MLGLDKSAMTWGAGGLGLGLIGAWLLSQQLEKQSSNPPAPVATSPIDTSTGDDLGDYTGGGDNTMESGTQLLNDEGVDYNATGYQPATLTRVTRGGISGNVPVGVPGGGYGPTGPMVPGIGGFPSSGIGGGFPPSFGYVPQTFPGPFGMPAYPIGYPRPFPFPRRPRYIPYPVPVGDDDDDDDDEEYTPERPRGLIEGILGGIFGVEEPRQRGRRHKHKRRHGRHHKRWGSRRRSYLGTAGEEAFGGDILGDASGIYGYDNNGSDVSDPLDSNVDEFANIGDVQSLAASINASPTGKLNSSPAGRAERAQDKLERMARKRKHPASMMAKAYRVEDYESEDPGGPCEDICYRGDAFDEDECNRCLDRAYDDDGYDYIGGGYVGINDYPYYGDDDDDDDDSDYISGGYGGADYFEGDFGGFDNGGWDDGGDSGDDDGGDSGRHRRRRHHDRGRHHGHKHKKGHKGHKHGRRHSHLAEVSTSHLAGYDPRVSRITVG